MHDVQASGCRAKRQRRAIRIGSRMLERRRILKKERLSLLVLRAQATTRNESADDGVASTGIGLTIGSF
ncbi:hypothetical protein LFL97_22710 [Burkholderia sp. JSH-S8]|uniref:hypothetical protein n=1 Tax=Burkholderia stagnalis TaxID=1503054 RepID=UPI000F81594D|nr:hypothetical protein [Burkholderia stagnalis]WGS45545.1 hypothetical protein LFL97_22710 [Burkholderia sp. JSH-S8]